MTNSTSGLGGVEAADIRAAQELGARESPALPGSQIGRDVVAAGCRKGDEEAGDVAVLIGALQVRHATLEFESGEFLGELWTDDCYRGAAIEQATNLLGGHRAAADDNALPPR